MLIRMKNIPLIKKGFTNKNIKYVMVLPIVYKERKEYMNTRRKTYKTIICLGIVLLGILSFNIYRNVRAKDNHGKITVTKNAEPTDNRGAIVTLGIHSSALEQPTTDIILVMDRSGSMAKKICVEYNNNDRCIDEEYRLTVAKTQAISFIENVLPADNNGNVKVGIVSFGTNYESVYSTKTYADMTSNQTRAKNMINNIQLTSDNGTNMQAGLNAAKKLLSSSKATNKIIILISDGEPTKFTLSNGTVCGSG